jgi:hypothetical protein
MSLGARLNRRKRQKSNEKPLLERYTTQLNVQETRLDVLQKEKAALHTQIAAANGRLAESIQKLAFDVRL